MMFSNAIKFVCLLGLGLSTSVAAQGSKSKKSKGSMSSASMKSMKGTKKSRASKVSKGSMSSASMKSKKGKKGKNAPKYDAVLSSDGWEYASWQFIGSPPSDPAWNLCNGLWKKCAGDAATHDNCENMPLPAGVSPLPCDKCRKICGGSATSDAACSESDQAAAAGAWVNGSRYPFIKDGPEDLAGPVAQCPSTATATAKVNTFAEKLGLDVWGANPGSSAPACVPDPASPEKKITVYAATGHALGVCGDLYLFKSSQDGEGAVIAQLQLDTRSWSFESSAIDQIYPQESSKGCNVPLASPPIVWSCTITPCSTSGKSCCSALPEGWSPGACP